MTDTGKISPPPVPTSVDNPEEWETIRQDITAKGGSPTVITIETITGMVSSAVPLLFEADATGDVDPLHGVFADPVIAQCGRNAGCLLGDRPGSATVHLVGAPVRNGVPVLRVHVAIVTQTAAGAASANSQFWDLEIGAKVAVAASTCTNCGAPLGPGQFICDHCGTDVRSVVEVPLVVSRLELY